jgi:hypothetical protein
LIRSIAARRWWTLAALLVAGVVVFVVGRSLGELPQASPAPAPTELAGLRLPGLPIEMEGNRTCAGVGVEALVVHGALVGSSPEVWVTTTKNAKLRTFWPSTVRARFEPDLIVVGGDGTVLAREGEILRDDWPGYWRCTEPLVNAPGAPIDVLILPKPTPRPS